MIMLDPKLIKGLGRVINIWLMKKKLCKGLVSHAKKTKCDNLLLNDGSRRGVGDCPNLYKNHSVHSLNFFSSLIVLTVLVHFYVCFYYCFELICSNH